MHRAAGHTRVRPRRAACEDTVVAVNQSESRVRQDLLQLVKPWIGEPAALQAVVDALMRGHLWWPDNPDEPASSPEGRTRDGASLLARSRPWEKAPRILQLLWYGIGLRAGDSLRLTKYKCDIGRRNQLLLDVARAEFSRTGSQDILTVCRKLAMDDRFRPLKAETIAKILRDGMASERP